MLKKLGVLCIIAISSFGFTKGEAGSIGRSFNDTIDIQLKDSINLPLILPKDPKEDFKDLFSATTISNGINIAQLNPLAVNFVEDYIDSHSKMLAALKDKARPYFDMIDAVLVKHGLPKELKYLAVIESQLKSNATSWAGAVGPWQFMPSTGRVMGLKVNRKVDERRDIYKSTHAASRYLTNLYSLYGDWLLVIAAYNGGPGKVNSAIKRSGSRDFWKLQKFLPAESRKHVKKFIATHYIMEGEGGITTLTKKETANFLLTVTPDSTLKDVTGKSMTQLINGRYNAFIIVKHIAMDLADFHKLNPNFDNLIASSGKYELRLPVDKMDSFKTKKIDILKESIQVLLNPEASVSTAL
ncbi:MAG: lytic transglycosylase domain-containing protein [Chitinophagaceae bacterium]